MARKIATCGRGSNPLLQRLTGVGQLVGYLVWGQEIASSTLVIRTMKMCMRGNHEASLWAFSKRSKSSDGLHTWCKSCVASYERERYHDGDKARKKANKQASIEKAQNFIWDYLSKHPCVDCGCSDPSVLEFDHVDPSEKQYDVTAMFQLSVAKITTEISKCLVRCANCHKKRTDEQFGHWRFLRRNKLS